MTTDQMMNEIREANLCYLMLAQTMIRTDKTQALFRLGLSESMADLIGALSSQQLVRVASRNQMMWTLRFEDELVWGLLTDSHVGGQGADSNVDRLHASVLMARQAVPA